MRKKEEWFELIDEWEESAQTQVEFCSQKDISVSKFRDWRSSGFQEGRFIKRNQFPQTTRQHENSPTALSFSQLSIPDSESPHEPKDGIIQIELPFGIVIRIPANACSQ